MKKNLLLLLACTGLLVTSCKKVTEFLDKPPGVDIDEDVIFSSKVEVERYTATMYQYGLPSPLPLRASETGIPAAALVIGTGNNTISAGITDEAEASEDFSFTQLWNGGSITPQNIVVNEDNRYFLRWQAIRAANIIIERIGEVPNADDTYKDQVTGEALFIRAINNFEMLKRYGGFPLVMKRIVDLEDSKIPRSTFEECVNAISRDCDEAVAKLPSVQPAQFTGRAHKGAALALKARLLLYAASPLFNAATPPISFGSAEDDKLLGYGRFDNNRWKAAADASKAVLDWAQGAGLALVDVPGKRIPVLAPGQRVDGNYRTAWEQNDNSEIILANKVYGTAKGLTSFPWQHVIPRSNHVTNAGGFWVGTSVTFNFVRKYEKRDGTPQTWNPAGGNNLLQKYAELDPRFSQTVLYVGARLHANVTQVQIWEGALSNKATCKGGHWMLKWVPDALPSANQVANIPIFRLNEFLLSYAEAINEYNNGPNAEAYDAVNRIRLRSGMPPLPAALSQAQFRQRVQNERDIELAFEDHRFNDIRRWKIAEQDGVMAGNFQGLEIQRLNNTTPFPTAFSYKPFVFETRAWSPRQYFFPFDNNEVLKGNLKQNPGWN
ncbi:RagB/SusD family nutrient uptake outer membrane protein [Flavitalea antarctica]